MRVDEKGAFCIARLAREKEMMTMTIPRASLQMIPSPTSQSVTGWDLGGNVRDGASGRDQTEGREGEEGMDAPPSPAAPGMPRLETQQPIRDRAGRRPIYLPTIPLIGRGAAMLLLSSFCTCLAGMLTFQHVRAAVEFWARKVVPPSCAIRIRSRRCKFQSVSPSCSRIFGESVFVFFFFPCWCLQKVSARARAFLGFLSTKDGESVFLLFCLRIFSVKLERERDRPGWLSLVCSGCNKTAFSCCEGSYRVEKGKRWRTFVFYRCKCCGSYRIGRHVEQCDCLLQRTQIDLQVGS
uniref:Uncharacterized protein n=1 Tax=Physcomitrium patens TaxID=3218 RepID=A0A7I4C017_PHYPA